MSYIILMGNILFFKITIMYKIIIKDLLELIIFVFKNRKELIEVKKAMEWIKNKQQLSRFIEWLDGYIKECYHINK